MTKNVTSSFSGLIWIIVIILVVVNFYYIKPFTVDNKYENKNTINSILHQIEKNYVDSINIDSLIENSAHQILTNLDPHSIYMNKDDVSSSMEMMQGSFEGIGVEFSIHRDTIVIVNVIPNGPSEKKGLQPSDRIIFIEDENVAGIGITNQGVISKLRGEKGSKVQIGIQNRRDTNTRFINIIRGKIPLFSLDVAYEIAPKVGYIKLNRFSATTFNEFKDKLQELQNDYDIENLILDLRGNSGGYLDQAIDILNEFFEGGKLLVYTKGKSRKEQKYYSNYFGSFKTKNVHVLIDEGSASASEIVAGAIQDHGRGLIIGARSFGKGLVQEQIPLSNGGLIRLTVSRYYTPSGRCIQKPYTDGHDDYFSEMYLRKNSQKPDSLQKFTTLDGRVVFGGGGITPDHIVQSKTDSLPTSLVYLYTSDFFNNLAFDYVDNYRYKMSNLQSIEFKMSDFEKNNMLLKINNWITSELSNSNMTLLNDEFDNYKSHIIDRLSALIIRQYWGWEEMQIFLNQTDEIISTSLSLIKN